MLTARWCFISVFLTNINNAISKSSYTLFHQQTKSVIRTNNKLHNTGRRAAVCRSKLYTSISVNTVVLTKLELLYCKLLVFNNSYFVSSLLVRRKFCNSRSIDLVWFESVSIQEVFAKIKNKKNKTLIIPPCQVQSRQPISSHSSLTHSLPGPRPISVVENSPPSLSSHPKRY